MACNNAVIQSSMVQKCRALKAVFDLTRRNPRITVEYLSDNNSNRTILKIRVKEGIFNSM